MAVQTIDLNLPNFIQKYNQTTLRGEWVRDAPGIWAAWRRQVSPLDRCISDTLQVLFQILDAEPFQDTKQVVLNHLTELFSYQEKQERVDLLDRCTIPPHWPSATEDDVIGWVEVRDQQAYLKRIIAEAIVKVDAKTALDVPTNHGQPYLFQAAAHGAWYIVRNVLDHRAAELEMEPRMAEDDRREQLKRFLADSLPNGHSVFTVAIKEGHAGTVATIIEFCRVHLSSIDCLTRSGTIKKALLSAAATAPYMETVKILLKNGFNIASAQLFGSWSMEKDLVGLLEILLLEASIEERDVFPEWVVRNVVLRSPKESCALFVSYWQRQNRPFCPHLFSQSNGPSGLLHQAVVSRKHEVVEAILQHFPSLAATTDEHDRYPLYYVFRAESGRCIPDPEANSRDALVAALITEKTALQVDDIARQSQTQLHEFVLDLSRFDSTNMDFRSFVSCLIGPREGPASTLAQCLRFERVLRLVKFPELTAIQGTEPHDFSEVHDVLIWLHGTMGVKKICTLVVPDRQYSPHSWDKIHWCVKTFQVEHLYWRAVDMLLVDEDRECSCDSDELRDKQQICFGTLRSLHLYCTGNKNTIQQWFSSRNGLSRLQKLSTLEIRIVEAPAMSGDKIQDLQDRLEKRLEDWRLSPRSDDNVVERVYTVERYQWNDEIGSRSRDAHDGTEFHIPELSRFLQQYRDNFGQHDQVPRTKVAVIDDGMMMVVNASRHSLQAQASSQVVKGKGFVYKDGSLSPWFSPGSDGHGTHMACLISRLDPHCDLHIAQVRGPNEPLYLSAVVMAIKWAIEQQVDIISMSLALRKTTPILESKLERAIQEAEQNHIVVICSTMDEGRKILPGDALPAKFVGKVVSIAATGSFGEHLSYSQRSGYDYCLPGSDLALGDFDFLMPPKRISGSSIATATASGLASLVLRCSRLALWSEHGRTPDDPNILTTWRKDAITAKFKRMQNPDEAKFILLEQLLEGSALEEKSDAAMMMKKIERHFQLIDFDTRSA